MDRVLLDTNIVSYLIKRDTRALLYRPHLDGRKQLVAFVTVAELYRWAVQHKWSPQRIEKLRRDMRHYAVIDFDDRLAWTWAEVSSISGRPMEPGDAWVAAAALRHGLPLVTHNRKHFEHIPDLQLISEAS
jgi:tRNA(fMet)-specific endonuclease VapC